MICRKIDYHGDFDQKSFELLVSLVRRIEITGVIKQKSPEHIELVLEGDPSMIKLSEHQIENYLKQKIKSKDVGTLPFQFFKGLDVAFSL